MKDEIKAEFVELYFRAFKKAVSYIAISKKTNEYISQHYKFPKTDFFNNGFPYFTYHLFSDNPPIQYSYIFRTWSKYYFREDKEFLKLRDFVQRIDYLNKYFDLELETELSPGEEGFYLYQNLIKFTEYYIHVSNNKNAVRKTFYKLFTPFLNSIYLEKLPLSICFPIPIIKFSFSELRISKNILFKRIPESIQILRNDVSASNSDHNTLCGAATHYLVLQNWNLTNPKDKWSLHSTLTNKNSFDEAIELAKNFLAALRLETGRKTGLVQLLTIPFGWATDWTAHLENIYRLNMNEYNYDILNGGWNTKQNKIDENQFLKICATYNKINMINENSFKLSLDRFNDHYTRKRERDKIIDITTALESLLTNDSRSEITYRLSNRIAILFQNHNIKSYSSSDVFDIVKKVYDFRSAIIHGESKLAKKRTITISSLKELPTVEIANNILKEILKIEIENEGVFKPTEIDKMLLTC